jgi:cyclopropane fatty-acyl-phospholipid synthase-like methyltransferase
MSDLQHWENRYATLGYHLGTEPNAFLKSQAHLLRPGRKTLSIADGEGRNGVWLAEQGLDVVTLEFSPTAVARARAFAAARGVTMRIEQADIFDWTWPAAAFDILVAIFFQFAAPDDRAVLFANMKKTLRAGGLLLMQGYRVEQPRYGTGGPSQVENLYTRALLEDSFGDFASLDINEHDSLLAEGNAHVGMSALIDLVGRK